MAEDRSCGNCRWRIELVGFRVPCPEECDDSGGKGWEPEVTGVSKEMKRRRKANADLAFVLRNMLDAGTEDGCARDIATDAIAPSEKEEM